MPTYTENGFYIDQSMSEWEHDNIATTTLGNDGTTITLEYSSPTYSTTIWDIPSSPKHFNCKRCGAPNQIDVCEYCGSAAEG